MSRKTAREEQSDETGKHATPSGQQGHGGRATRCHTRRRGEKQARRQANDEGKHDTTPQDKMNDAPPTTRRHEQNRKTRPSPQENAMMTNQARERHETLHETARREEKREAREHPGTMSEKSHSAPFSPTHMRMRQGRMRGNARCPPHDSCPLMRREKARGGRGGTGT